MQETETATAPRSQGDRSYTSLLILVSFVLMALIVGVHLLIAYRQ
jgi:hypothetical protein